MWIFLIFVLTIIAFFVWLLVFSGKIGSIEVKCPMCGRVKRWDRREIEKLAAVDRLAEELLDERSPKRCREFVFNPLNGLTEEVGCGANLTGLFMKHPYVRSRLQTAEKLKAELQLGLELLKNEMQDRLELEEARQEIRAIEEKLFKIRQ